MKELFPINLDSDKLHPDAPLTSVEMSKLWATYMGNSMSKQILSYFLKHVEDQDIKTLLKNALNMCIEFLSISEDIFNKENFPKPIGFTEGDVNLNAPRLYKDEFYVHYLKYAAKAGLSLYSVAIPMVMKENIRDFFIDSANTTATLLKQINLILMSKGFIIKPPVIPIPDTIDFVTRQSFLYGFVGDVRPAYGLEITHLYDNIENNTTSKALLMGFYQVVQNEQVKELFNRGFHYTEKSLKQFSEKLTMDSLPSPSRLDHLVTTSTVPPFSDKLMLWHKVDMFSMKIRAFGNSLAISSRRDLAFLYGRCLANVFRFVDDGANIMIDHGWMEQPPKAIDREHLAAHNK